MKLWTPLAILAASFMFSCAAHAGDVQVTSQKQGKGTERGKATEGNVAESTENFVYALTLANRSLKPTEALEVKYIVFIEHERIGEKKGQERTVRVAGSANATPLQPRGTATVQTETISLKSSALQGGYYYEKGGKVKAQDSVKGLWVRVYQGETMVGEMTNPTTLASREKWEK